MNDQKSINVYFTVDAGIMSSLETAIAKTCFGVSPGNNQIYSFNLNKANGHFSFGLNQKHESPVPANQKEGDALKFIEDSLAGMNNKLAAFAKGNSTIPKDLPVLFNFSYMSLNDISQIYSEKYKKAIGWRAIYGIELVVFDSQGFSSATQKSVLERDSIIVEIAGNRITKLDYKHTPIKSKKSILLNPDPNSEFIYKKVNKNTVAPYYLTSRGYIPASKLSIPINDVHRNFIKRPASTNLGGIPCKSMLTVSNIVEPTDYKPGSAKIVIAMDYRLVTLGEGVVNYDSEIRPREFSRFYEQGNIVESKKPLQLVNLPSKEMIATTLNEQQEADSKSFDTNGLPIFWEYYNVNVEYQYNLEKLPEYTLWEANQWMLECEQSRGIIYLMPFLQRAEDWYYANKQLTKAIIKRKLPAIVRNSITDDELDALLRNKKQGTFNRFYSASIAYVLTNIISENIAKYSSANLYIGDANSNNWINVYFKQAEMEYDEFQVMLSEIDSIFYFQPTNDDSRPWVSIENFYNQWQEIRKLVDFALEIFPGFKTGSVDGDYLAAGQIGHQNIIVLNPKFFGIGREPLPGTQSHTEVIVHEAGHNSAALHTHAYELYQYYQTGLQSNSGGYCYPTRDNTLTIIKDSNNREHMTIL